ncbi:hypothetical protein SK803_14650 [Lentzea sp. BCCO 10_0856]|uniref:DUF4034 domain-containing protein n=1 Tax=Lentzea miocenica TaxID=3095431 RepID=A0ABU4SZW6_9PSEU|nr:hypothetical protein [Lentzea sp. BCCO 10_0856]MDX8031462.1 hypothetical protein [Lentzea sp. BCCO 10_0856]
MMEEARRDLARMRESRAAWRELRYSPSADGDANEVPRAKVLWALQYDRRPDDLPLLRFLAEQEALLRGNAAFQGIGEQTELAGFLLAEHRRVEDVWRQHAIKRANFDTWCGYDRQHLYAAGWSATISHVRGSDHPERDAVLELLGDEDDDDLDDWRESRREWFPDDLADEDPLTWVARAKLAGRPGLARAELDRWAADRPRDIPTLNQLRYELADLGAFAEAALAQRECLVFAETDADRATGWRILAGLERQAGEHRAAWEALRECGARETGRDYVEELFLLAGVASPGLARQVFAEADRKAEGLALPLVVLQAAVEAARNAGGRVAHYERLRDEERQRIGL